MAFEPFMKWGLDFMGLIKSTRYIKNQYIITVIDYITKWVKAKALHDNTVKNTIEFIMNKILFILVAQPIL
jgi:hypothetical protein